MLLRGFARSSIVRGRAGALALMAIFLLGAASSVAAQQKRYTIPHYEVMLAVQGDGAYDVTERIAYDFQGEPFTHADRHIPLEYIGELTFGPVAGENAATRDVRSSVQSRQASIEWKFPPTLGSAAFTLSYVARGALFERDGRDIVDWDAIGRDWSVPIANAQVAVLLPASLVEDSADIQVLPAEGRVTRTPEGWRVDYAYGPLPPHTAYRVLVAFPRRIAGRGDWPGVREWEAAPTSTGTRAAGALAPTPPVPLPASYVWLLPLAALLGFLPGLLLFRQWGPPRREAVAAGAAPAALPRAAAILPELSGGPNRVFSAVLFDLAARGHVALRRVSTGKGILAQKKVEVVYQDDAPDPLSDFEQLYLEQLRRYGTLDEFGRKGGKFRRTVVAGLRRELLDERLMENHPGRTALCLLAAVAGIAMGVLLLALRGISLLPAALFLFAAAPGLLLAAFRKRVPTESGALLRAQVLAFLAGRRKNIEQLARTSPIQAAEAYLRDLPWMTLDPKVTGWWLRRIVAGLKKSDGELVTPGWASDLAGRAETGSAAYAAFMPYYHVTTATAGAASPGAGGAGAAGAGAGGGAGGGGGGAG